MVDGKSSNSYYSVLGVPDDSSDEEIRRAYRKLAMQWHPDKWTKNPSLLGRSKRKFQQIQEAYSVLSDKRKRTMYDAGLYDPAEEHDEGFCDFLQEMMSLMDDVRKEKKNYSMEELQSMFMEMAKSFEFPEWSCTPSQCQWPSSPSSSHGSPQWGTYSTSMFDNSRSSKIARCEANPASGAAAGRGSYLHTPGFSVNETNYFCS